MNGKKIKKAALGSSIFLAGNRKAVLEEGKDANNVISRHYRVMDSLVGLLKKGKIDLPTYEAGQKFAEDFNTAGFNGLKAIDYNTVGGGKAESQTERVVIAKDSVHHVLRSAGGMQTPCGKILWEVVGEGVSINQWALSHKWERREAVGILISALAVLAVCYGYIEHTGKA